MGDIGAGWHAKSRAGIQYGADQPRVAGVDGSVSRSRTGLR